MIHYKLHTVFILSFLVLAGCENRKAENATILLRNSFAGTWKLLSRTDKDANNITVNEPTLGSDPISILIYDTLGNMSVQLMKRNRKGNVIETQHQNSNNLVAFNGYDAYFGSYRLDTVNKEVTHRIEGSINPEDVGKELRRNFMLTGDTLRLSFSTINAGVEVIRTLTFIKQRKSS